MPQTPDDRYARVREDWRRTIASQPVVQPSAAIIRRLVKIVADHRTRNPAAGP